MDIALRAIAEPRRREILRLIMDRELSSGDIAVQFDVTGPAISQHLRVLVDAGLVTVRKEGVRRFYCARPEGLAEMRRNLEGFWRGALDQLAAAAGEEEGRKRHGKGSERN